MNTRTLKIEGFLMSRWIHVQSPGFGDKRDYHRRHPSAEAARIRERNPEAVIVVQKGRKVRYIWHPGEEWSWGDADRKESRSGVVE
jgi:hypothetical protein